MSNNKAKIFADLHQPGSPLILINVWDVGSTVAVTNAGAKAIATGSKGVAGAYGFEDGENFPWEMVLDNSRRIVEATDLPVTIDMEGGYGVAPDEVAKSAAAILETGAVGVNFEDQKIGTSDLYSINEQAGRIAAVAGVEHADGTRLFVNARSDVFLKAMKAGTDPNDDALVDQAIERAHAYAEAGASCFFAPALSSPAHIERLCKAAPIGVNILVFPDITPTNQQMAELGVARISYGHRPWHDAMVALELQAKAIFAA